MSTYLFRYNLNLRQELAVFSCSTVKPIEILYVINLAMS